MLFHLLAVPIGKWHRDGERLLHKVRRYLSDDGQRRARPIKRWELGVEFFPEAGGLGYRQQDGTLWFSPIGGTRAALLPPQMLKIIAAAGEPLPGWPERLPEDWLAHPRRNVRRGQKRPVEVLRAFRDVLTAINANYPSLACTANAATAKALRSLAEELRKGGSDIDRHIQCAKRAFSRDKFLKNELAKCIAMAGKDTNEEARQAQAARLDFLADTAEETREKDPLIVIMPSLDEWYKRLFDKTPTRVWKRGSNALGEEVDEPGGAFPALASALFCEVGLQYTQKSIHSKLGRWLTLQKSVSLRP